MMTPYEISANGVVYTVVNDVITTYWALITGSVVDDVYRSSASLRVTIDIDRADLQSKSTLDGAYAITGIPGQAFPQLASVSTEVNYVLSAPGFADLPVSVIVPVNATFPVAAPNATMRRLPIMIRGRIVNDGTRLPIAGAILVSVDNPATPPTVHVSALRTPLSMAHANGAAVQQVTVASAGVGSLTALAAGGDPTLSLSARSGLSSGSVVRLTSAGGVQLEYGLVDHLGPGAASAPGDVVLQSPLYRSYASGTAVDAVTATPSGGAASLSAAAYAGDGVLLASQQFTTTTVVIDGGGPAVEWREIGAVSDADGFFGLDGIGRVPEIFLKASNGALNKTADWYVEYDQPQNIVNFRL